jgi:hypothetical protein
VQEKEMVCKRLVLILLSLSVMAGMREPPVFAEMEYIKSPKPTHVEKKFKRLVLHKEIPADFDEEYFLAQPSSIVVDNDCNFFVYDRKLLKIFKFSKDFTFEKCFGSTGDGPGEYDGRGLSNSKLYISPDGNLLLSDAMHKKIIVYDTKGNFREEIRLPRYASSFHPVVDREGRFFLPSRKGGLDVYDKKGIYVQTLLTNKEYQKLLLIEPSEKALEMVNVPSSSNTKFDVLSDGRLIVYIKNASTAYVFKDLQLQKKFSIIPKIALESFARVLDNWGYQKYHRNSIVSLFNDFFFDRDEDCFYLEGMGIYKYERSLYKFSPEGELLCVLRIERKKLGKISVVAKRNNFFFSVTRDGDIKILKEES